MRMFRLLKAEEIECRVSEIGKDGTWLNLLLYKTARTDASLLDEAVGPLGWANDYRLIDGKMYCGIGIRDTSSGEWVWKWNVGTESNTEAEKGEASDALKRAGFVWGIGTELYSSPRIFVRNGDAEIKKNDKNGKWVCYDRFFVRRIGYGDREQITELEIVNQKTGRVVFTMKPKTEQPDDMGRPTPVGAPASGARKSAESGAPGRQTRMGEEPCRRCKTPIDARTAEYSRTKYNMPLCRDCQTACEEYLKAKAERENNEAGGQ